jgi:hypothetical protein
MLHILGGAPRSGKTLLSKQIVKEKQIPYFPLDALMGTITESLPELNINHDLPFVQKSRKIWKISKNLCYYFVSQEKQYLIEGDCILPEQVHELVVERKPVLACFVGYCDITAEEKLKIIRKHASENPDWTNDQADEKMIEILNRCIDYSRFLKESCEKFDIPFFDVSMNFTDNWQKAYNYLFSSELTK